MTPNDRLIAYIRTYVPYAIGAALAWLLTVSGWDLTGEFQIALVAFVVVAVTNLYYLLFRILESRIPWLGAFLGVPKAPEYVGVSNLWASFRRTAIPTLVGAIVTTLLAVWFHVDAATQSLLIAIGIAVIEAAYYGLARALITRWSGLAWMLGTDAPPTYDAKHA